MAIYKSSFNQKPEKKQKIEKEEKPKKEKQKSNFKLNGNLVCLVVCLLLFVSCLFPWFLKNIILGVVGLSIYPLTIIGIFFSTVFLLKKGYRVKKKYVTYLSVALLIIWFILHLILTSRLSMSSYGTFLGETYKAKTTAGGIVFSLLSYLLSKYLTKVGAYIVCGIALAIIIGLLIDYINTERTTGYAENKSKFEFNDIKDFEMDEKPVEVVPELTEEEKTKVMAKRKLGLEKGESTIISSSMPNYEVNLQQAKPLSKKEYILTPLDPVIPPKDVFSDDLNGYTPINRQPAKPANVQEIKPNVGEVQTERLIDETKTIQQLNEEYEKQNAEEQLQEEKYEQESSSEEYNSVISDDEDLSEYETAFETDADVEEENEQEDIEDDESEELEDLNENYVEEDEEQEDTNNIEEIKPNLEEHEFIDEYADRPDEDDGLGSTVNSEVVRPSVDISKFHLPNTIKQTVGEPEQIKLEEVQTKKEIPPYVAPPVELLNFMDNVPKISDDELQDNIVRLEQVLEDFKVPAKVNNVQVGPAVTRYELTMPRGISVNKIAQMSDDIAMTLASNGSIRVEAPIPGKNAVGIEVPNNQVSPVSLRELIDSEEFRVRQNPLSFVLGKDINGDIIFCNLDKMPHVLVAGSTGSGKSVCLNTMLLSMCYKAGPQDLRLILVDPKMVEFATYNGMPHLLIPEVITNKDMTINALDWAIKEMERRYALFAKNHVVNINEYNKLEKIKNKVEPKLPYIVIVVDELADLMLEAKREIEDRIAKLAAKARAAGIHLVLATQRPSVDVITGTVKANLPSRIAFALTNYMDSKTVLDGGGAEKLLGKGDMLFKPQDKPEPRRIQGAFVSSSEITEIVEYIKSHNQPVYDDDAGRAIKNPHQDSGKAGGGSVGETEVSDFDPVLKDALKWFIQMKQGSGSMISRRYSVGFNRAGRIMDQMERAGFIGPQEGAKPRQVLITMDEYNAIFGDQE